MCPHAHPSVAALVTNNLCKYTVWVLLSEADILATKRFAWPAAPRFAHDDHEAGGVCSKQGIHIPGAMHLW